MRDAFLAPLQLVGEPLAGRELGEFGLPFALGGALAALDPPLLKGMVAPTTA